MKYRTKHQNTLPRTARNGRSRWSPRPVLQQLIIALISAPAPGPKRTKEFREDLIRESFLSHKGDFGFGYVLCFYPCRKVGQRHKAVEIAIPAGSASPPCSCQ